MKQFLVALPYIFALLVGMYFGIGCLVRARIDEYEPPNLTDENNVVFDGQNFAGLKALDQYKRQQATNTWLKLPLVEEKFVVILFMVLGCGLFGGALHAMKLHAIDRKRPTVLFTALNPVFGACIAIIVFLIVRYLPAALTTTGNPFRPETAAGLSLLAGIFSEDSFRLAKKKFDDLLAENRSKEKKQ